jgi:hypothetical protein
LHKVRRSEALGERELGGPVDGVGLAAHVDLPGVAARLAAAAGFLLAAEGAADLGAAGADVDVGDAAVAEPSWPRKRSAWSMFGEDRRREALRDVVVQAHARRRGRRLVEHDVEDRGEGLLLNDVHVLERAAMPA